MKKLASARLSAPFVFGLLLRGTAARADHPGSSPCAHPRRRGRVSRAGWTLAVLTLVALAGSTRSARGQTLVIDDRDYHNSPTTYSDANGTQTFDQIVIGYDSTGIFYQTGGSLTVNLRVSIGDNLGTTGTYSLSGGSLNAGSIIVGGLGTGTFNQSGGTVTIPTNTNSQNGGRLVVANGAGMTGTYNLSAGSLSAEAIFVGAVGSGTFTQTRGNVTSSESVVLGDSGGSNGTYNLSAGSLTAGASFNSVIGNNGTGTFNQTGGTFSTSGNAILLANNADGTGVYKLSAGSVISGYLSVGYLGLGTFTQTGGSVTTIPTSSGFTNPNLIGTMTVGQEAGSTGTYNLSGQGSSLSTRNAFIGNAGTGTFNQSGGTFTTNGNVLYVGDVAGGSGTFNLSGTGSLSTGNAIVGYDGVGTFNQTGGTFTTNGNYLVLGYASDGTGTYNLNGGVLTTGRVNGNPGASTFNFNGGTLQAGGSNSDFLQGLKTANVRNGGAIIDTNGYNVIATQSLTHSNITGDNAVDGGLTKLGEGTLTLTGSNTYTGQTLVNQGTLAVTGGSVGVAGTTSNLTVNLGSGGTPAGTTPTTPSLTLSGSGTQVFFNNAFIGSTAAGSVTQSGGTFTTGNVLYLGYSGTNATTGNGTYTLTGGNLNPHEAQVGNGGTGTFNHSGGTQTVATTLYLGLNNGTGTYNLSGNGVLQAPNIVVGYSGTGTFNQTGGTPNFGAGSLILGNNAGSSGTYQLGTTAAGATATLNASGTVYVGYNGAGIFNHQTSGFLSTNGNPFYLGYNNGSSGTYNQSGGTANFGTGGLILGSQAGSQGTYQLGTGSGNGATLNLSGPIYVGYNGTGVFNQQSDGSFQASGSPLYLGYNAGSMGTYNLSGNGIITGNGSTVGYAGTGVFNNTGGYDTVNGTLVLGHAAGSQGTYNLNSNAILQAGQISTQGGTSTFNFNGGTLVPSANNATFLQGLTSANVRNGGARIGLAGSNVTVAQNLVHSTIQGDNATDGGLTVNSGGVLTLTGNNTYNGGTNVQGSTLLVNNTSGSGTGSGQVTVGNNATLGGSGTIGGNVVAQASSTVAPGAASQLSTARLTLNGTLTLQNNALLAIKLGGSTGGSGYDQVFASVGFTLGGDLQVSLVNGFVPAVGQPFTILDNTNLFAGNSGVFANAPGGTYTTADGLQFAVNYATNFDGGFIANDVTLFYLGTVVPEPGTWTLLAVGAAGFAVVALRRRRERPVKA